MANPVPDPHDAKVESVPLPDDDAERVVVQENQGREGSIGGGEWPSPKAPSTGPSPGDDGGPAQAPGGAAEGEEGFPPMKDSLAVDPVTAGSSAVPDDDEGAA